ncbi:DUF4351 domain-containing protein [Marinobacter lacisalsi]|uniref:DUF4351 domain-containing protein n=1 Tax=Marinobacter lacisalsi TaxID=475979 RepID=A0ABV8QKU6_9GAMM
MAKDHRYSHDQNFKNLILDYPLKALEVFCPQEAEALDQENVRIIPLRQEQLKERLGNRFRELDVPLLAEWPDGRREALLFVLEEESDPRRFSIHRLAHYCLDLAELCDTQRIVPVVIFLRTSGNETDHLTLGGDHHQYLNFRYIRCALPEWEAETWWDSPNLVARLLLSVMHWRDDQKLEVYARSVRGLTTLEPDPEKQLKYIDFIDIYSALDDNEMEQYKARYPQENQTMTSLSERLRAEGMAAGIQSGERAVLIRLLERRFGPLNSEILACLNDASQKQLETWADRILDAESLDEIFQTH